ncbi:unnamed protein product [Rotaria sp. Silwood1]|nr:unnamed protein product [Rotaria sp. Silwood1]CAF1312965.1 unnamed protein product [Rotaria sp. Silwood1]
MGSKGSKKGPPKELTPKQLAMLKATTQYSDRGGKADTYCQLAFSMFDANHDGVIDFNEYLLAVAATSQGDLDDRLEVAFHICDTSDDGQIDRKELAAMISAAYDLRGETNRKGDNDPKKRAAEIISRIDVGGDKKLNKYEFIAGCKNDPALRQLLAPNV